MKMNLVNKACSIILLAAFNSAVLSAPISLALADGNHGGSAPTSGTSGGHSGNDNSGSGDPSKAPSDPSKPAPSRPAPSQPTPAQPVANNPPQHPGPGPGPGDDNGGGDGNTAGAIVGGAVLVTDILGAIFSHHAQTKAVAWNWGEDTDTATLVCYPFNKYNQQIGTAAVDDSKCAAEAQPIEYDWQQNADGTESCMEYYTPNGDLLNGGQPVTDDTLCPSPVAAN